MDCREVEVEDKEFSADSEVVSYIHVRILGKGAHGQAVLYRNSTDNSLVVWKEIVMEKHNRNEIQKEINILSILDHPNIIAYYNHFVNINTVFIEMEYANNGSLSSYLHQLQSDLGDSEILWYFFQIIFAVEYIHKLQIIHRDIKPLNIFMTTSSLIKIGDFGISKVLEENELAKTQVGTPMYLSPEVIQGFLYSCKSDIWACGCVLYELISRRKLFEYSNQLSLAMKIVNREFQKIPNCNNPDLVDLLQKLLIHDPVDRFSATQALQHPVWNGKQQNSIEKIHRLNLSNVISRPFSGDRKERSIVSLNSEVFIWGGGKTYPVKIDHFKDKDCALQVESGSCHFAVLTVEKDLYTWSNAQGNTKLSGQLGHNQNVYRVPKLVQDLKGVIIKEVSCGAESTICLSCNGEMFGCGSNYYGQLGIGTEAPKMISHFINIPIRDPTDQSLVMATQINCGYYHTAAIAGEEDRLYTWGYGEYGRLGSGSEENVCVPTLVEIPLVKCKIKMVYCGFDSTFLVIKGSDRLLACGNNEFNKLGINISATGLSGSSRDNFNYDVPFETKLQVVNSLRKVKVSVVRCGQGHTVVLDVYNKLYICGDNRYGQLGLGDTKARPGINNGSKLFAGKKIERISCGDYFTVVSTTNNEIYAWGRADNGRLGLETARDQRCVLYPRPLFGALQNCADIKSFGWQTIMIAERVIESNTISTNNSSNVLAKAMLQKQASLDSELEYTKNRSSEIQPWLQAELDEADVIYMDEASYESKPSEVNEVTNDEYSCHCGCSRCIGKIRALTTQLKELQDKFDMK